MTDTSKQQIGKTAEHAANQFLQARGLTFIAANFRKHTGEIDLIMQDKDDMVFVEVRVRTQPNYGSALESVNLSKQRKLIKTALLYLQQKKLLNTIGCRFDVIAIDQLNPDAQIDWVKNAFSADYL